MVYHAVKYSTLMQYAHTHAHAHAHITAIYMYGVPPNNCLRHMKQNGHIQHHYICFSYFTIRIYFSYGFKVCKLGSDSLFLLHRKKNKKLN